MLSYSLVESRSSLDINIKQLVHLATCFYIVTLMLAKIAVLLEWLRVFVPTGSRNAFFWACHITIWINALFYVAVMLVENLNCFPFEKIWDKTVPGRCVNQQDAGVVASALNVASDVLILLLPHRVIWKLQMTRKLKIGVSIVFGVGLL